MNKLILVVILSVAILAFSQASMICSADSDCNDYSTFGNKVCETNADPLLRTCVDRTGFDFKTTTVDAKGKCKDSLNSGTGNSHICGAYASLGCTIEDADQTYIKCSGGSERDTTTKKCVAPKPTDPVTTYVGEGARCDERPTKRIECGDNLSCIDNVCRAKLNQGDNCLTTPVSLGCKNGLTCDGDFCVPTASKWNGEGCKTSDVCRGGACAAGVCLEKRAIPCYSNTQCDETCYKSSGSLRGTCTQSGRGFATRGAMCQRDNLQKITSSKPVFDSCSRSLVESVCQSACQVRPDQRIPSDTSYTYNCQTMTRTAIPDNTCLIKEFVTGCPAIPIAGAMVNGLSVLLFALIALIFA